MASDDKSRRQMFTSPPDHQSHADIARSISGFIVDNALPPKFNDALDAYNEVQEASFTYEAFLLDKHEEDRVELEALRRTNEDLVNDFADLLASYKDLIQEFQTAGSPCPTQQLALTDSCLRASDDNVLDPTLATRT